MKTQEHEDLKSRFQHSEAKKRVKFLIVVVCLRLLWCIYYVVCTQAYHWENYIPLAGASVGLVLLLIGLCLQVCHNRGRLQVRSSCPLAFITMALVVDAAFIALTRTDLQIVYYRTFPEVAKHFGARPHLFSLVYGGLADGCAEYAQNFAQMYALAELGKKTHVTSQIFYSHLLFFIGFVLPTRHSVVASLLATISYSLTVPLVKSYAAEMDDSSAGHEVYKSNWFMNSDCVFMILIVGTVACRQFFERAQFQLFQMHIAELVNEKVLRCKAEFGMSECPRDFPDEATYDTCKVKISSEASLCSTAPTAKSAPPILTRFLNLNDSDSCDADAQGCAGGDCLPADAMAFIENSKVPQSLKSLQAGERILCYDNLSKQLTYAPIVDLKGSANAQSVKVYLSDGSSLEMTADHPVTVQPRSGYRGLIANQMSVRAGDIQPEEHSLMMMRMVWTSVTSISHFSEGAVGSDVAELEAPAVDAAKWITISVAKPERHEIFVTQQDEKGMPGPPIAVGSSDRLMGQSKNWTNKNTFVHVTPSKPVLKRSNSAPLLGVASIDVIAPGMCSSAEVLCCMGSDEEVPRTRVLCNSDYSDCDSWKSPNFFDPSVESSDLVSSSSPSSKGSVDGKSASVKIGMPSLDNGRLNVASMNQVRRMKEDGALSFGSHHPNRNYKCSPCSFYFSSLLHPSRPGCKAGALCDYCHDSGHHPVLRSKLRKNRSAPRHVQQFEAPPAPAQPSRGAKAVEATGSESDMLALPACPALPAIVYM